MRNLIVAGVMLGAMVGVQHFGLERTREKALEDRYTKLADLPASSVLPSYIASLFLGSFRAIVVDALWIELRAMRDEEHRYFETIELMKFISVLQPRNPEVWVQQAQDAAWNIANPMRDKVKKWQWIMIGFDTLDRGVKQLPDNPYLKFEIARTLFQKPTISDGRFDEWYLAQVEGDGKLQSMLQGVETPERAKSAFELAIPFLERAAADVRKLKERNGFRYYTSQTGYNLSLSTLEGYQRSCMFYQAHHLWRQGRAREAAAWFRKAAQRAQGVWDDHQMPIYKEYAKLDEACAGVAEMDAVMNPRDPRAVLALLEERILPWARRIDFDYVRTMAGSCRAAMGGDGWEWNDSASYGTDVVMGRAYEANLAGGPDEDWYVLGLYQVEGLSDHHVLVENGGTVPIDVRVFEVKEGALREQGRAVTVGPREGKFVGFVAENPGNYFVAVLPQRPPGAGDSTAYRFSWQK